MNRFDCLNKAAEAVQARESTYGAPEDLFSVISGIYATLSGVMPSAVPAGVDGVLFMCVLKLARAAANPQHADNWVDLAGYAALGFELSDYLPAPLSDEEVAQLQVAEAVRTACV